ncbi:MAG: SAM-dependent methyltransferase [Okeania sp. SIO3B5]|uniref:SAM-dependent methyltransferase n=1 Tax=Okeania sp. SIO3B5 TaxID=2607811 RepID=UPI001400C4EE|nr:SAM-dependent methyltransferase [Okeania sp. SIO3B5]NEO57080.1 SAM-dependent methyltransferase [Okeania sp. SIO3B5]
MTSSLPAKQSEEFVPFSARLMAAMRAKESKRLDSLFNDPFAGELAGEEALTFLEQNFKAQDQAYVILRTHFFDNFLLSTSTEVDQVVILAAGMDTRAYRLPWSSAIKIYELDRLQVLEIKKTILQEVVPKCQHYHIGADLTQPWTHLLLAQGYQSKLPSVWLLEGLLVYLDESEVHQLLKIISELATTGSYLGLDLNNVKGVENVDEPYKSYFRFGCDDPEELLAEYGWEAEAIEVVDKRVHFDLERFSNLFPSPDIPNLSRGFFVRAKKK